MSKRPKKTIKQWWQDMDENTRWKVIWGVVAVIVIGGVCGAGSHWIYEYGYKKGCKDSGDYKAKCIQLQNKVDAYGANVAYKDSLLMEAEAAFMAERAAKDSILAELKDCKENKVATTADTNKNKGAQGTSKGSGNKGGKSGTSGAGSRTGGKGGNNGTQTSSTQNTGAAQTTSGSSVVDHSDFTVVVENGGVANIYNNRVPADTVKKSVEAALDTTKRNIVYKCYTNTYVRCK